ncbi:MAG: ATP-binding protein [Anaerolineae bacterium]
MALLRHDVLETLHSPNSRGSTRQLTLPSIRRIQWEIQRYAEGCVVFVTDVNVTWQVRQTYHAFVNSLAHELRTPLTSILAHSDLLDDAEIPPSGREASRKVIQRETRRLMRLIQGAVELIRLEMTTDLTQQPIDLVVLAEGAVAQMIPLAEQREIELSFRVATPLPRTLGDADQLMRVFVNVLDNAVKYSRPGDRVDVVLSRNETGIVCAISDTGPGIATEHLPFVCQRLYRGRHDMDGSGLGLALAQEILHKHQSSLDIQSQTDGPTTGTTVRFVLMPAVDS